MSFDQVCDEVLSLIEYDETSLLNWGFLDVENDLERSLASLLDKLSPRFKNLWDEAQADGKTADDVLRNLVDRLLVFPNSDGLYRSRYAETMRLLVLLRQRFTHEDWASAPRLVGDARIQLQRRRYPKRDVSLNQLEDSLADIALDDSYRATLHTLLTNANGQSFHLSGFQQRAIHRQLQLLKTRGEYGIVVGAGTGSGKTKAFYIPALTWLSNYINQKRHVAIMAIYPRVELLKDQFAEAVRETQRLNTERIKEGKRQISIGAYYGDTPRNYDDWNLAKGKDWIAPFLKCPRCESDLVWRVADRTNNNPILKCTKSGCGYSTDPAHVLLTREQMRKTPPDILFTTTEMLNRRLAQIDESQLFGIRASQPPRLLLLDEIHTYEGISGANVAYLLRRWRQACHYGENNRDLCIVGLSATLSQATEMFSKLTGLSRGHIYDIRPSDDELEEEGIEYNVALKGDPSSGTALLSTSIQTAMLLGRTLSPLQTEEKTYPPRIFAFCNRLDTLNRWFDNQEDAESKPLSQFRFWNDPKWDYIRPFVKRTGQDWNIASLIGNDLTQPMVISRTSSQAKGVSSDAKLVLATSALEVGFNDPRVGAVIQHQTPYSMASFLQRKGRAGRDRQTRPWTIIITSAYGRDRWAFQHSEMLFNPLLPPINLPIENYYVRKLHAAYILMDWIASQLYKQFSDLNVWTLFTRGTKKKPEQLREILSILQQMLNKGDIRSDYVAYLRKTMGLQGADHDATVRSLLWGEPRPILLEVIPTLIRQLETNWQHIIIQNEAPQVEDLPASEQRSSPMPEFVPSTLFSDLNLPELTLDFGDGTEAAPFIQTFEEIVPGKVSKRYLHGRHHSALWIEIPEHLPDICSLDKLSLSYASLPIILEADGLTYELRRPITYHLKPVPQRLDESSTAFAIWRSSFRSKSIHLSEGQPLQLALQPQSAWQSLISSIEMYAQTLGTTVEVTRGVIGIEVSHLSRKQRQYKKIFFAPPMDKENEPPAPQPAGIGYTLDVDGMVFSYYPLDLIQLKQSKEWKMILQAARPAFYLYRLQHDPNISAFNLTPFEIEWCSQVIRSAVTATAISSLKTLREAAAIIRAKFHKIINETMNVLFQGQGTDEDSIAIGRLHQGLQIRFQEPDLQTALLQHLSVLWELSPEGLDDWLVLQYAHSLGATFYTALGNLLDDVDPSDLRLDIEADQNRFWITESNAGGIGLIAKIAETMSQQPRRLELQLLDAVRHCDREHLALELQTIAHFVRTGDQTLSEAFNTIRTKKDFVSLSQAKHHLTHWLDQSGLSGTRSLVVAINSKFLRPSSDVDTDIFIIDLIDMWYQEQEQLGCDIDLRVFAVAATQRPEITEQLDAILKRIGGPQNSLDDNQRFNLLQSMLWMDCHDSCEDCIQYNSRYQTPIRPSRTLLHALLSQENQTIHYGHNEWRDQLIEGLSHQHEITLSCKFEQVDTVKSELMHLLTEPLEVGLQMFYPVIERIERRQEDWLFHLVIREMVGL